MDTRFKTTFMSKQPIMAASQKRHRTLGPSADLLGIVVSGIFVLAFLFAAGTFLYERLSIRRVVVLEKTLAEAREAFEPAVIEELKRDDARMKAAEVLVAGHRAATPLFRVLEDETLRSVQYSSFAYTVEGGPGGKLKLDGRARGFRSVALQADTFGSQPDLINPVFSNLDQDVKTGFATFDFEAQIGKRLMDYGAMIESEEGAGRQ
ncbi:MAG: hypothetical protein Q8R39_03560 [bacterium]|nr:hypothetical protein [bacterium]MDZ4284306.1 hypothetical protein [Patescibacteria group bacterium]